MADYEVEILVNGKPIKMFRHKGDLFVEGRKNSKFELKIKNNTWQRIEAVPSVDGLSVLDGKACGEASEGYLVPARDSIVIPGWRLDNDSVAEFVFKDKRQSYSKQTGQGTNNVGVIGFMIFKEKEYTYPPYYTWGYFNEPMYSAGATLSNSVSNSETLRGMTSNDIFAANTTATASSGDSSTNIPFDIKPKGYGSVNVVSGDMSDVVDSFSLGTGWGDEVEHRVTIVDFERKNPTVADALVSIYYDSRKGLEARGIKVVNTRVRRAPCLPDPFPTYNKGCTPPPGWKR